MIHYSKKSLEAAREWVQTADPDAARRIAEVEAKWKDRCDKVKKKTKKYEEIIRSYDPDFNFSSIKTS